jgi:hypothetical protein
MYISHNTGNKSESPREKARRTNKGPRILGFKGSRGSSILIKSIRLKAVRF